MSESREVGEAARSSAVLAPSARAVRDFVNTFEPQVNRELLTSPQAAGRWLADHQLLGSDAVLDDEDLAVLLEMREGLRELLRAHTGEDVEAAALERLDSALARLPLRVVFDAAAEPALAALPGAGSAQVVAALLDAVYRCMSEGTWNRLKVCARHSCRWAFYDTSRNRSGRWCSMNGCGNQVKMRRAYAVRKERAAMRP
jgi:predicted RNA-binding Zn ribbon-like protein